MPVRQPRTTPAPRSATLVALHPVAQQVATECFLRRSRSLARFLTDLYTQHLASSGLTAPQFTLLCAIGSSDGPSATHLCEPLCMDKTTLARALARLRRDGLIRTEAIDKRQSRLWLTASGRKTLDRAADGWTSAQAEATKHLGAALAGAIMKPGMWTGHLHL